MKKHRKIFTGAVLVLSVSMFSAVSWSADLSGKEPAASISIGAEFSSGTYNSATTTSSLYIPLVVSWYPTERLDMSIEVPYVYQSSSQVTTSLYQNNAAVTSQQTVARRGGPGGMISNTTSSTVGSTSSVNGNRHAVSGLGDIILRTGYIPVFEQGNIPQLRASLFVKTPTASVSDGLGTGEFDYGGGFDLSKWFGDFHLAAETSYTWQGKIDGYGLKNYFSYTLVTGYQITRNLRPMLVLKGASAPSEFSDHLRELRARMVWNLTSRTSLDSFISRGLSDSSPDYGGGISAVYSF